jgi:hypothetical protein
MDNLGDNLCMSVLVRHILYNILWNGCIQLIFIVTRYQINIMVLI